jgi:hypothetical protein
MKNSKRILLSTVIIGIMLFIFSVIIFILSWIIYKSGNFLFSYFGSDIQVDMTSVLITLFTVAAIVILPSLLIGRNKSKSQSKAMKYEDDFRWINEYMGDEY